MNKSNNADAYSVHYDMFQLSGVWPKKDTNVAYKIKALVASWIIPTALCVTMAMEIVHDIRNDFSKVSEVLYIMMSCLGYLLKLCAFTYHRQTFLEMIDFLKSEVFLSYPDDLDYYMARTIKKCRLLANAFRCLVLACIVMFAIYPAMDNQPLPFPFSYALGSYRYPFYVFQVIGIFAVAWNNSTFDTFTPTLMEIGAAQLDILIERLVRVGKRIENVDDEHVITTVKQCIEHHVAVIKYIGFIEEVFSEGILPQFLSSIIVICNTLFCCVLVPVKSSQFFMLTTYLLALLTELSMYCWFGNEVQWKSGRVADACYMSHWYNCGNKVRQYLFIAMERSKRPLAVTAWKFSKLSLSALMSILQWSYSYLALLLKMHSKQSSAP